MVSSSGVMRPILDHVTLTAVERAALDAIQPDALISLASDLIAIPSIDGHEVDAQRFVAGALARIGADVDTWSIDMASLAEHPAYSAEVDRPEALGVVGAFGAAGPERPPGRGARPTLMLNGHIDVVPTGDPDDWTTGPFSPTVRDGRLYGRGACDMKGGLAAAIHAIDAVGRAGVRLDGRVVVASVVGEEDGGCGTLATLLHGITADACVIPEPTELAVVPTNAGALSFRIRMRGLSAHGATRSQGVSTIEKLPIVQDALFELERGRNARSTEPLFAWLDLPFAICVGKLSAGDWPSSVADWLTLEGRYGIAPGEDLATARAELETAIAEATRSDPWLAEHPPIVEWWGGRFLPGRTDVEDPIVSTVGTALRDTSDRALELRGMPYGCDMGLTTLVGGIPTVVFGPGDVRYAHKPNEQVPIDDLVDCARALALTIVRFCKGSL